MPRTLSTLLMKCPGLFRFTCWVSHFFFYFLPFLTVRLFYSISTQVPSVIPFHTLFKAFSHSFCIPHHYNVDNSSEIPISVLLDSSRIQPLCYWEASAFSSSSSCSWHVLLLDPQYKDLCCLYFWNEAQHPFLSCLYYSRLLSSYNSLKKSISKQNKTPSPLTHQQEPLLCNPSHTPFRRWVNALSSSSTKVTSFTKLLNPKCKLTPAGPPAWADNIQTSGLGCTSASSSTSGLWGKGRVYWTSVLPSLCFLLVREVGHNKLVLNWIWQNLFNMKREDLSSLHRIQKLADSKNENKNQRCWLNCIWWHY